MTADAAISDAYVQEQPEYHASKKRMRAPCGEPDVNITSLDPERNDWWCSFEAAGVARLEEMFKPDNDGKWPVIKLIVKPSLQNRTRTGSTRVEEEYVTQSGKRCCEIHNYL